MSVELDRMAEWRLAQARGRLEDLETRRADLLLFLGAEGSCADMFANAMLRRLDGLEKEIARARADVGAATEALRSERARLRRVDANAAALAQTVERQREKTSVLDAIETFLQRAGQGSDKS